MRPLRSALAIVLGAALLAPMTARATCGAESCPFVRQGLGSDGGRFTFDLRYQDVTQDRLWSGTAETGLADVVANSEAHGEVELYTRTRAWVAEARARLVDRLHVTISLPYVSREHRHMIRHTPTFNALFVDEWKYEGPGDATILSQYIALRRESGLSLAVQAGAKLPTGRRHVPDEERENFGFKSHLEPSARPGSGSTDWLIGAIGSVALPWAAATPITVSALARLSGTGTDDYRVGNEYQAGLAGGWSPIERVTLLTQLNFVAHDADVAGESEGEAGHSAMRSLFVTPGASVRVAPGLAVYGLYQARVWGSSDEATIVARDHVLVGTSYALGR